MDTRYDTGGVIHFNFFTTDLSDVCNRRSLIWRPTTSSMFNIWDLIDDSSPNNNVICVECIRQLMDKDKSVNQTLADFTTAETSALRSGFDKI